jgi:hypothetical protein
MKDLISKTAIAFLFVIASATMVLPKEWRAIVPLRSTREDVERILGTPQRRAEWRSYYSLPTEIVVVHFQVGTCDGDRFGLKWNVPPGTVVSIGVIPKGLHSKEEYLSPNNFAGHDNGAGFERYTNAAEGLSVETHKKLVTLVEYYPEASKELLQCPQLEKCCVDFSTAFDEYSSISFEDEKARLDNFLIHLNEVSGRGVITVVGPSKRARDQLMKRAARAKAFLVRERRLEQERLLLVDAGYRAESATNLSMYSIGGLVSWIYIFSQDDPLNVAPNKRLERTRR